MKYDWTFVIKTITPKDAEYILQRNEGNRKLRKQTMKKYASIMEAGNWIVTPEAIVISKTGRLLNGQHRLSAVVDCGRPVDFLVAENVSDDVFHAIDRGATRTVADALRVDKKTTEVARLAAHIAYGTHPAMVSDDQVKSFIPIFDEVHETLRGVSKTNAKVFSSTPFRLAACTRILAGDDEYFILNLYHDLVQSRVGNLPPIGQAAVGAVLANRWINGGGQAGMKQTLAKAWDVFDASKQNNTRVQIKDADTRLGEIRVILNALKNEK